MRDLGTLGGTTSYAAAINGNGWVVGAATTTGDVAQHAFVRDGTSMTDLNTAMPAGNPLSCGKPLRSTTPVRSWPTHWTLRLGKVAPSFSPPRSNSHLSASSPR